MAYEVKEGELTTEIAVRIISYLLEHNTEECVVTVPVEYRPKSELNIVHHSLGPANIGTLDVYMSDE